MLRHPNVASTLLFVLAVSLHSPVRAADLSQAPAVVAEDPAERPFWTSCFGEAGGSVRSIGSGNSLSALAGIGCSYQLPASLSVGKGFVIGLGARYGVTITDFDTKGASLAFDEPVTAIVRAGVLLNHNTLAYAIGGYSVGRLLSRSVEAPVAGLGIETRLFGGLSIAAEVLHDQFGDAMKADSGVVVLRHRF